MTMFSNTNARSRASRQLLLAGAFAVLLATGCSDRTQNRNEATGNVSDNLNNAASDTKTAAENAVEAAKPAAEKAAAETKNAVDTAAAKAAPVAKEVAHDAERGLGKLSNDTGQALLQADGAGWLECATLALSALALLRGASPYLVMLVVALAYAGLQWSGMLPA